MMVLKRLWNDEAGFVVSTELVLLATVAVVGLITGITAVRDGVVAELSDVAGAVQELNQGYQFNGIQGHNAASAGTQYIDQLDDCDSNDDPAATADNCIVIVPNTINEDESVFSTGAP